MPSPERTELYRQARDAIAGRAVPVADPGPELPVLQTPAERRSFPVRGATVLQPDEAAVVLGSDLVLSIRLEMIEGDDGRTAGAAWLVTARDSDANHLGTLGQLQAPPDGAALALFAELARRVFPLHAEWTARA